MGELPFLQAGALANFTGSHFWNLQECVAEEEVPSGKNITRLKLEHEMFAVHFGTLLPFYRTRIL